MRGVAGADRAAHRPRAPSGRVVVGPLGDVEVEGSHGGEHAAPVQSRRGHRDLFAVGCGRGAGPEHHPLLPRRGDIAGQLKRVDTGVVGLQIGPKQFAQQVGMALQRGEVHRCLTFLQVAHEHIAHGPTRDPVAVDQRLAAGLSTAGEHLDRSGCIGTEVAMRAQQLIEQRAVEMSDGRGPGAGDGSEQLDAVADPHLLDWAALGRHDDPNIGQCLLLALQSDPAAATQRGEGAERTRGITRAGHLDGKVVPRRREPQQPVQAGADHIGADQHQQPGAQVRQWLRRVGADQPAPVRPVFGAAGPPPLLPAVAGLDAQPVQHGQHPQPPGLLTEPVVQRERRGQHPGEHLGAGRLGRWPRRRGRSGRKRRRQLRPGRVRRSGHRGRGIGGSRRQHLRVGGHDRSSPKRIARLSAR